MPNTPSQTYAVYDRNRVGDPEDFEEELPRQVGDLPRISMAEPLPNWFVSARDVSQGVADLLRIGMAEPLGQVVIVHGDPMFSQ